MALKDRKVFNREDEIKGADFWEEDDEIILDTLREIFRISAPLRRPQDTGGVFLMTWNVMDLDGESVTFPYTIRDGDPRLEETIGVLGPNDTECPQIVREKAERLLTDYVNSERTHHSSWQSRDLSKQQYGGAIMAHTWVLSFSGCSEAMDEAICVCLALVTGMYSQIDADYIVTISGNEVYPKLLELVTAQLS